MPRLLALALAAVALAAPSAPTPQAIVAGARPIPAGTFTMGGSKTDEDARPAHRVKLGAYAIGAHEVTNAEYKAFVDATHHATPAADPLPAVVGADRAAMFHHFADRYVWKNGTYPAGQADHPVVLVRWSDAAAFCAWLSQATGRHVRLPTEAQWERAARGGLEGKPYAWGDGLGLSHANYLENDAAKETGGTRSVGRYAPNGFGLYDMNGNVWEWVADWYQAHYYASSPATDPRGPVTGTMRIVRGGAWVDPDPALLDLSHRHDVPPDTFPYSIGFRIVVE